MEGLQIYNISKWFFARVLSMPAIFMPYKTRIWYIRGLSAVIHAPFVLFGKLGRYFFSSLHVKPAMQKISPAKEPFDSGNVGANEHAQQSIAILFSGGTDSLCVAAISAQQHQEVHLLTFYEYATQNSPSPEKNIASLKLKFPQTNFKHSMFSVDGLVRYFWYENYIKNLKKHGLLTLATCGFSSLSWHTRTILYCLEHNITRVADGLTRELMHFPGHMDDVVEQFRELYKKFGIIYENPVRNWPTPPDQQFIDKVIVNNHGGDFLLGDGVIQTRKTTGHYLFSIGLLPNVNVKGSSLDFKMQHDCYPFALYNILAFWGFLSFEPYEIYCILK